MTSHIRPTFPATTHDLFVHAARSKCGARALRMLAEILDQFRGELYGPPSIGNVSEIARRLEWSRSDVRKARQELEECGVLGRSLDATPAGVPPVARACPPPPSKPAADDVPLSSIYDAGLCL